VPCECVSGGSELGVAVTRAPAFLLACAQLLPHARWLQWCPWLLVLPPSAPSSPAPASAGRPACLASTPSTASHADPREQPLLRPRHPCSPIKRPSRLGVHPPQRSSFKHAHHRPPRPASRILRWCSRHPGICPAPGAARGVQLRLPALDGRTHAHRLRRLRPLRLPHLPLPLRRARQPLQRLQLLAREFPRTVSFEEEC
jgi:hypothetical protein